MHNASRPFTDIPMNGKSASQTPQTPETFKIEITYEPEFTNFIEYIRDKYGEELLSLSGVGKEDLDRSKFANKFFKTEVTADASIDPNSNLSDHSTISYSFESGKSFNKLNSLYLLWKSLVKSDGLEAANDIAEKVLRGDLYVHDMHGIEAGKPYCVAGDTLVRTECGDMKIEDIAADFENGIKHSAVINDTFKADPIVQVHTKNDQVLLEVKVRGGTKIKVTPDHKLLTCNKQKEDVKFKQADQIVKGDRLLYSMAEIYPQNDYRYINGVKVDEDTAAMLAYMYSYAGFSKVHPGEVRISFDKDTLFMSDKIIGQMKKLVESMGEDPEKAVALGEEKPKFKSWFVECIPFAEFVHAAGLVDQKKRSSEVFIHDAIKHSPESVQREFLKYMFGSVAKMYQKDPKPDNGNVVYFCWSNKQLTHDIGQMLSQTGTPGIVSIGSTACHVNLNPYQAEIFLKKTGMPDIERVADKSKFSFDENPKQGFNLKNTEVEIDGSRYLALPVMSITQLEGKHKVYDIGTENSHMFLAYGFVVHNCFNYSTYDVMAEGLPMVNKIKCIPPKHLFAFKSQVEQFTILASNSTLGA